MLNNFNITDRKLTLDQLIVCHTVLTQSVTVSYLPGDKLQSNKKVCKSDSQAVEKSDSYEAEIHSKLRWGQARTVRQSECK